MTGMPDALARSRQGRTASATAGHRMIRSGCAATATWQSLACLSASYWELVIVRSKPDESASASMALRYSVP